jgi:uncharacterized protein (TIGR02118 family)
MSATITLLYPTVAFDLKYYLSSHMPMVQKTWGSKGLKSWQVSELDPKSGHSIQCVLVFESTEAFGKAMSEDEAEIMGDVKNYTEGAPVVIIGKIVGSS